MPKRPTQIMAIINTTPDSFFEGSRVEGELAIAKALEMVQCGADILDIGGESSRPDAEFVNEATELQRVIPVIKGIAAKSSIPISIDTVKPAVAKAAIEEGATLLNDVSGFNDPGMVALASAAQVKICLMHRQGSPKTMQLNPEYPEGIIPHLINWFRKKIADLMKAGIREEQIIIDPGIGMGKTIAHNVEILENLPRLKALGYPLLFGASRKSFIQKILNKPATELLSATVVINTLAVQAEADIIRVHDVSAHRDLVNLLTYIKNAKH